MSPCDNEAVLFGTGPTLSQPLPGSLGSIDIHVSTDDVFVRYDDPGDNFDTLAGADLQELSVDPTRDYAVCVVVPLVGGFMVSVNLVTLDIDVCTYSGQPYTLDPCLVP